MNLNNKNVYKYTCRNSHSAYGGNKKRVSNGELNALKDLARLIISIYYVTLILKGICMFK